MLKDLVASAAGLTTSALFAEGLLAVVEFRRTQSTGSTPVLPFIAQVVQCLMWMKYGLLIDDTSIVLPNTVGLLLGLVYLVFFDMYASNRSLVRRSILKGAALLLAVLFMARFAARTRDQAALLMGYAGSCGSVSMFGSPLADLKRMISERTNSGLTFTRVALNTLVPSLWTLYGLLVGDPFVSFPNAIGVILGLIQSAVYFSFRSSPSPPSSLSFEHV